MNYLQNTYFHTFSGALAIALCDESGVKKGLTYTDIAQSVLQISKFISMHIKEKHVCLALKMSHNVYIPSILVCLRRLEHAFMFLNVNEENTDTVLHKLGIAWLLTFDSSYGDIVDEICLDDNILYLNKMENNPIKVYKDIFYVVKTSGTTGDNKFVKVQHPCIEDNIKTLSETFKITKNDIIYFGTPLTFDPSMIELLLSLHNGACLLIVPPSKSVNQDFLFKTLFFSKKPITFLQTVPSLFLRWSHAQIEDILLNSKLKILAFGGEQFPEQILSVKKSQGLRIFNLYGVTEVSCWATVFEVDENCSNVPIGEVLGQTVIEVRDSCGQKILDGEGEIFIGSSSRLCLIDEQQHSNLPVFRGTGDLGVISDNQIFYSGRKNYIIKRFGHKINLSVLEKMILKETGLQNKCIWFMLQSKLLSFLVVQEFDKSRKLKIIDKIRVKLLHLLPKESFPDHFLVVPRIPVTVNGKVDVTSLQNSYFLSIQSENKISSEELFKLLLSKYFGLSFTQLENALSLNFLEIGGNSILAIQLLSEFAMLLNIEWPSSLTTLLLEKDLKSCLDSLKTIQFAQKRQIPDKPAHFNKEIKRLKTDTKLKIDWTYNLNACVDATPTVFEDSRGRICVAVGSFSHIFAVLDATTGAEISKFILPDNIEIPAVLSPCKNYLYVGCFDGKLYCLDYKNHKITWNFRTGDRIKCKPCLCEGHIIFGSYDKYVYCITNNGGLVWKTLINEAVKSDVLYNEELKNIFVAGINGTCLSLSQTTGEIIWTYKSSSPIFGSGCFLNNSIVFPNVTGQLICLSFTGKELWQHSHNGHLYCSLVEYENDCLIFGSHDNHLHLIKVNSKQTELLLKFNLESPISSTPCLTDKNLIIVSVNSGSLFVIDVCKKCVISDISLPSEVFSSPVTHGDKIYIGCRDNNLYCLNIN